MSQNQVKRARRFEELDPLTELCKAGRLFDVQGWIEAGKPVNPPTSSERRSRKRTPLDWAIDLGFHSLVQVLLEGGAEVNPPDGSSPMSRAIGKKRLDIIQLLVEHGYDPKSVNVEEVFASWDPEIMEFFIDRGADITSGSPLARALCDRIQTALRVVKKYRDKVPSIQHQVDNALRHHCREGNLKWVSLLLWAGADPFSTGESDPDADPTERGGLSALGFAALYNHYDVFDLKQIKLSVDHPGIWDIARYCYKGRGVQILEKLLTKGLNPNDQDNGGCSMIPHLVDMLEWTARFNAYPWETRSDGFDTSAARERLKVIHLLAKNGGRWVPKDAYQLNSMRRSLLKMTPDYTVEFIWIMARYGACSKSDAEALLRTPKFEFRTFFVMRGSWKSGLLAAEAYPEGITILQGSSCQGGRSCNLLHP